MISRHVQSNHLHFLFEWSYSGGPCLKRMLTVVLKINIFLPVTFYKGEKPQDKWMTCHIMPFIPIIYIFRCCSSAIKDWHFFCMANCSYPKPFASDMSENTQWSVLQNTKKHLSLHSFPLADDTWNQRSTRQACLYPKIITANRKRNSFMSHQNHLSTHHKSRPTAIRRNSYKLYALLWPSDSLSGWEEGCWCSIPRLDCLPLFSYSYTVTVHENSPHCPTTQTHSTAPMFPVIMNISL